MKHDIVVSPARSLDRALAKYIRAVADGVSAPIRLIVGGASSPLAKALWPHVASLSRAGGELEILLKSDSPGDRREMDRLLAENGGADTSRIRIARFQGADGLAEQLVFGDQLWATGGDPQFGDSVHPLPSNDFSIGAAEASFKMIFTLSEDFADRHLAA